MTAPQHSPFTHGHLTKNYALVIDGVTDNRRRNRLTANLSGFVDRVQESAFEATLSAPQLQKLLA